MQAQHRSMNIDLIEGMTDGKYVKRDTGPNRGGISDPAQRIERRQLLAGQHWGAGEAHPKIAPDGTTAPNAI